MESKSQEEERANLVSPLIEPSLVSEENPKSIWSHNVVLSLIATTISGIADSTWSGTVIVSYIYILTGSNSAAGYVEAVQGLAQLISALPVGYLADKYSRSSVIFCGGIIALLAIAVTVFSTILEATDDDGSTTLYILICALFLWGICSGITTGPLQALFADSIPTGKRSKFYVYLFTSYVIGGVVGPVVSIIVFHLHEDKWYLMDIRDAIYVGMGLEFFLAVVMFFFDDKKTVNHQPENKVEQYEEKKAEKEIENEKENEKENESNRLQIGDEESFQNQYRWAIPYITFLASLIVAIGAGMTVKFFPLYFKNDCLLSPSQVQAIYAVIPVTMVFAAIIAQKLSVILGRVQTVICCRGVGIATLFVMTYLEQSSGDWRVMVPLYIVRASTMNATFPLEESIMMDFVPKETRARWKSLESIAQFGWCGSAALGGVLADAHGYPFTFLITACIQGFGLLIFACLLPLVPRSEKKV